MTSISRREKVLLGYETDSLSSCSGDVDFSDVFGGPPRRFSIQESRNGSSDSGDGGEFRRSLLLGFGEKPVFGNEMGSRRKYQNDDFFDDIFRGDQSSPSCSQSPRVVNARDSFSSAPGSRVMSPSRPLPPSAEPLIPPAKFSLPVKLTSTEFAASPSATQSWNSPSSYPSRLNQTTQTQNFDSYRPSPLSHQTSMDAKQSPKLPKLHHKSGIAKESKRSSVPIPIDCNQFHFSIYKWPNKSVPLLMPVRKIDRFLSSNERAGRDIKHDHGSLSFNIRNNDTISSSKSADSHCFDHEEIAQELPESVSSSSSLQQVQDNVDLHGLEDVRESVSFTVKDSFLQEQSKADDSKSPEKKKKFDLRSFLHEERKGDEIPMVENGGKERKVKEKEKPSLDDFVPSRKINKVKAESFRETKDEPQKDEGIGGSKVKDFVNIFNQESSSKAMENDRRQSQSFRWKDTNYSFEVDSEVKFATTSHEEVEATSINWENSPTKDLEMAYGDSFLFGKQQFDVKSSSRVSATPIPALPKEPNHTNGVRDSAPNIKTIQDVILNQNMIEDVSLPIEVQKKDEMKIYENKIRQWSKGKEGNIRALLSTLQNVLWPNSGWKAVPLVDIIEANAVKRAYQKALLRLHPDKLQQKGAPSHQKFIAEKVFDVLQEAWDHFNSLGSF